MPTGHVSVKEAVLPFARFAGADSVLGPEMKITGEVMGDRRATSRPRSARPRRRPASRCRREGTVFITVTDTDKAGGDPARGPLPRPRLPDHRHRRAPRRRSRGWACRSTRDQQDRRGLAARRRLHRRAARSTW